MRPSRRLSTKSRRRLAPALNTAVLKSSVQRCQANWPSRASSPWSSAILGILIYVWFRFEWQFAVGAVMSLLHDVLLTIGLFCLLGIEFNLQIIAAILTIVGYSLNDTVVVFDRIREYLRKYKSMPLADLIDFSLNSVLPRTILTSVTTMLALIALYIFGGEVLRGFTFTMIWGVIIGTYSSIFIASPVLILLGTNREGAKELAKAKPVRP